MNFLERAKLIAIKNYLARNHSFNTGLYEFIRHYDPLFNIKEYLKQNPALCVDDLNDEAPE